MFGANCLFAKIDDEGEGGGRRKSRQKLHFRFIADRNYVTRSLSGVCFEKRHTKKEKSESLKRKMIFHFCGGMAGCGKREHEIDFSFSFLFFM
jgi:hypothetical protein